MYKGSLVIPAGKHIMNYGQTPGKLLQPLVGTIYNQNISSGYGCNDVMSCFCEVLRRARRKTKIRHFAQENAMLFVAPLC